MVREVDVGPFEAPGFAVSHAGFFEELQKGGRLSVCPADELVELGFEGNEGEFSDDFAFGWSPCAPIDSRNLHACSGERNLFCSWVILAVVWARPSYSVQYTSPNRLQISSCPRPRP